ncbi:MAG: Cu(I)-responsive transcriptional regulator [Rhizobiales bacterium]|nr:Cu(I)-responsive transcriptional regulator [Hyphomicrobiales bacterium]
MNIGEAAKATGLSTKMIRHYEGTGLLRPPVRTRSGYRVYSDEDVHTLHFIRRARDLGFSVRQMADLLALWQNRKRSSADVKRLALAHADSLELKMRELQDMAEALRHLARHCHGDSRPACPIIAELAAPEPGMARGGRRRLGPGFAA